MALAFYLSGTMETSSVVKLNSLGSLITSFFFLSLLCYKRPSSSCATIRLDECEHQMWSNWGTANGTKLFYRKLKNGILRLPIYIPYTVAIQIIGIQQNEAAGWRSWFQELLLFNTKNANSWRQMILDSTKLRTRFKEICVWSVISLISFFFFSLL